MQENKKDDVIEIDLEEIFGLILHRLWLILLCGVIGAVLAFCVSAFLIAPKYESTTGIYVMSRQDGNKLSYSDTQLSTQLTKDYEELISSRYVLETVIARCGLEEEYERLLDRVTIQNASDTRIIYITVKDTDPERAQYIADSVREVASEHIKVVTDVEAVNVVDQANLPKQPSEPSVPKWTILGALIGLILCAAIVIVRHLLDDTIKSSEDVARYLDWGTLALIPLMAEEETSENKRVMKKHPTSVSAETAGAEDTEQVM